MKIYPAPPVLFSFQRPYFFLLALNGTDNYITPIAYCQDIFKIYFNLCNPHKFFNIILLFASKVNRFWKIVDIFFKTEKQVNLNKESTDFSMDSFYFYP